MSVVYPELRTMTGQLKLPTTGTSGGILMGEDVLLYRGAANKLYLLTGDGILLPTTSKIEFRDVAISISSKDDGHLDLDADVSIDLNAPRIEIDDYIEHAGDMDTYMRFQPNQITLMAGNTAMVDLNMTALGFFGATKTAQAAHLADPTDLTTCIAAISTLIDELKAYGLVAADP